MQSSIRKAIAIASGSQRQFDAWMGSGQFTPAQIREATALRSEIARKSGMVKSRGHIKKTLDQVLAESGDYTLFSKSEKEDTPMPTLEDKIERGRRMQKHISAAIEEIVKRDGCSRARAAEIVSYSPQVREMLDLERREHEVLKSGSGPRMQNSPTVGGGAQRPVSALTTFNDAEPVDTLTSFNTPGDSNEVISAADLLQRRAAALKDRNPGLSMSAALNQAMAEPRIRKALDAERNARLHAASRIYG